MLIQRISSELHGAGNDDLGGDGIEDLFVPVNYQTGNLSHDLTLQELLTHVNLVENIPATFISEDGDRHLDIREPHLLQEVS